MTELKVKTRNSEENINKIRREGLIPAVVYSKGKPGSGLAIDYIQFEKVYEHAGESSLVDLVFEDGRVKKVLITDAQLNPVNDKFLHVDFYEVDLTKKVTAPVELEFVGEAPIVKNEGGILVKHLDEIEIECLPTDLIKKFKIDVSGLKTFDDSIHIKDLSISEKIEIKNDPQEVVVNVSEPRAEEEPVPAEKAEGAEGENKPAQTDAEHGQEGEAKEGEVGQPAK